MLRIVFLGILNAQRFPFGFQHFHVVHQRRNLLQHHLDRRRVLQFDPMTPNDIIIVSQSIYRLNHLLGLFSRRILVMGATDRNYGVNIIIA